MQWIFALFAPERTIWQPLEDPSRGGHTRHSRAATDSVKCPSAATILSVGQPSTPADARAPAGQLQDFTRAPTVAHQAAGAASPACDCRLPSPTECSDGSAPTRRCVADTELESASDNATEAQTSSLRVPRVNLTSTCWCSCSTLW